MELRARAVAEGALAGRHRSRRRGRAMEFSGHRPYTPSDDWRRIDWRAFARTDRWVVREDETEANRRVLILLDVSASMGFHGPARLSKLRTGAILSAALAYGLIRRGEAVGAALVADGVRESLPIRAGGNHLAPILDLLDRAEPEGRTRLPEAMEEALASEKRRTWVIVVSDFWFDGDDPLPAFRFLRARGHEAAVLCPLDPLETELSMEGETLFRDMENGQTIPASPDDIRGAYRTLAEERFTRMERALASLQTPSVRCFTDRPLDESLAHFLEKVR